jgi:hypothetical protein
MSSTYLILRLNHKPPFLDTLDIRIIHNKDDKLDDNLNKKNVQIAVISETKIELRVTKETNSYLQIYSRLTEQTQAHAEIMIMIHKSLKSKIDNHKY